MAAILKALRVLGDEGRLRILRLLADEELSVAELQDVLGMGQSRISMHLARLREAGLVELRRSGQKNLYRMAALANGDSALGEVIRQSANEIASAKQDDRALRFLLRKRKDHLRNYFDELAGRFGRKYVPGRSWKALAEMMLKLMPQIDVADLGAGEGTLALLLTQRAARVIAVDSSEKMVEYGREVAKRHNVGNLDYRLGDFEEIPVEDASVDLALFHQSLHHALHPAVALREAHRILRPGGRLAVLDLLQHRFEAAREMYADVWLGFSEQEIEELLQKAGFTEVEVSVVDRAAEPPHFESLLATGCRAY